MNKATILLIATLGLSQIACATSGRYGDSRENRTFQISDTVSCRESGAPKFAQAAQLAPTYSCTTTNRVPTQSDITAIAIGMEAELRNYTRTRVRGIYTLFITTVEKSTGKMTIATLQSVTGV